MPDVHPRTGAAGYPAIAQAIVALLQQASEIDGLPSDPLHSIGAAADNFFTGFR